MSKCQFVSDFNTNDNIWLICAIPDETDPPLTELKQNRQNTILGLFLD